MTAARIGGPKAPPADRFAIASPTGGGFSIPRRQTAETTRQSKRLLTLLGHNGAVYECKVTSDGASGAAIER